MEMCQHSTWMMEIELSNSLLREFPCYSSLRLMSVKLSRQAGAVWTCTTGTHSGLCMMPLYDWTYVFFWLHFFCWSQIFNIIIIFGVCSSFFSLPFVIVFFGNLRPDLKTCLSKSYNETPNTTSLPWWVPAASQLEWLRSEWEWTELCSCKKKKLHHLILVSKFLLLTT